MWVAAAAARNNSDSDSSSDSYDYDINNRKNDKYHLGYKIYLATYNNSNIIVWKIDSNYWLDFDECFFFVENNTIYSCLNKDELNITKMQKLVSGKNYISQIPRYLTEYKMWCSEISNKIVKYKNEITKLTESFDKKKINNKKFYVKKNELEMMLKKYVIMQEKYEQEYTIIQKKDKTYNETIELYNKENAVVMKIFPNLFMQ